MSAHLIVINAFRDFTEKLALMRWTRLFPTWLPEARMVAALWTTIHPEEAGPMAQTITVLGIDIAKLVLHVVGMDDTGHVVLRKRMARGALLHFIATLPPALIGLEACGRVLSELAPRA
jgi:hypothetical protein